MNTPPKTSRTETTPEQQAAIAATARQHGLATASKKHGRPYPTCRSICVRLGVRWKKHHENGKKKAKAIRWRGKGMTLTAIAKKLNVTAPCVRSWCMVTEKEAA